ncbi:sigma-70 family RNA polymerase sigma factor, partial [Staphylococcus sp. GDX7P459A]
KETLIMIYLALHTFDFSTDVPFEQYLNCIVRSMRNDFCRRKYIENDKNDSIINDYFIYYKFNQSIKHIEDI